MSTKAGYVYIVASKRNGTLYLGVTSNLPQRIYQHRNAMVDGFAKEHCCKMLVWYEAQDDLQEARHRELQMKKWKRAWKLRVIEEMNPDGTISIRHCSADRAPAHSCAG